MDNKFLIIRTDANNKIGCGHFIRCFSIALEWKKRGRNVVFITNCKINKLLEMVESHHFEIEQINDNIVIENELNLFQKYIKKSTADSEYISWIIIDGYQFESAYLQQIKLLGSPVAIIDDLALKTDYYADLVLNQNIYASSEEYPDNEKTHLLLGPAFCLLRKSFNEYTGIEHKIPEIAKNILITFGGSDTISVNLKTLKILSHLKDKNLKIKMIYGGNTQHFDHLSKNIQNYGLNVELIDYSSNMPELMDWADIAITAGGTTCWETAFMRLPNFIFVLADNQIKNAEWLENYGISINWGQYSECNEFDAAQKIEKLIQDKNAREQMSEKGRALVDGEGVSRVVDAMENYHSGNKNEELLAIRKVRLSDAKLIWVWANDVNVRKNSFNKTPIPWESHINWFYSKITSDATCFLILENRNMPVAQIRYEKIKDNVAEINFSVAQSSRGKGYGAEILKTTIPVVCKELNVQKITGIVFNANIASEKAFIKAGYSYFSEQLINDIPCKVFERVCEKGDC